MREPLYRHYLLYIRQPNAFSAFHISSLREKVLFKRKKDFFRRNLRGNPDVLQDWNMTDIPGIACTLRFDVREFVKDLLDLVIAPFDRIGEVFRMLPEIVEAI